MPGRADSHKPSEPAASRKLNRWALASALLFGAMALAILLFFPTETLYKNGGATRLGDIFRALEALLGNAGARVLLSLPFSWLAWRSGRQVLRSRP